MTDELPDLETLELPDLRAALVALVRRVPAGRVVTYGTLAEALGHVRAARWVAEVLADPPDELRSIAHRVVRRTGELGGHFEGEPAKEERLVAEGVDVTDGRIDLESFEYREFTDDGPLVRLLRWQNVVADRVRLEPYRHTPKRLAAVDVAYPDSSTGIGSYVLLDTETYETLWSTTVEVPITFPYVSGFLAYRELPVHAALLAAARTAGKLASVLFVDGNGLLHPRRAGVACQLGVMADLRTIGVGKKLLCGHVDLDALVPDTPQPVVHDGETIGTAVRAREGSNPFFVSPGHRIDVPSATRLARALTRDHRLPEPIHRADRRGREV